MYLDYYGLKEKPFTITPNPKFIFLSKNHKEVFAHLLYGVQNQAGFVVVTGEVGTGKTTVLRTLLGELQEDHYRLAFIFNPCLSATELLRNINREFGIADGPDNNSDLLRALNEFLLEQRGAGRTVVLVIDEAQNLEPAVLEQIRLLSNLETETDKLIQIVLVGQPELKDILARSDLRQLNQRITVRYHLKPMDFTDTSDYISHRLRIAGGTQQRVFGDSALKKIFSFSKGYPRLINILCDRALLVGYAEGCREIDTHMVQTAIGELGYPQRSFPRRTVLWFGALVAAVAVGVLGLYLSP
ncbi:ExeA family protein [Geoalkalibacter halelectricus]|uniref:AAA family ATPase n=1 Tax=Geoalkalibacter halelectricus TaxID=2847045 RepID=A0ABY5ZP38_9BACT|nr:AAA family ATPase [Geoalkalibacter halelectricus]MDO3379987.1 AAA family ATPase [Geoalkalibacter halelectricus]UWZ80486.1 AAA family ATPase [Geoalkalibacter halelectricus]